MRRMLLVAVSLFPLSAALAEDPGALRDRLHRSEVESSLDSAGIRPWHLKMTVQLFGAKGEPTTEQGTIEEWWSSPEAHRLVYTMPDYTATEVVNAKGSYFSDSSAPLPLRQLLDQVVHPVPGSAEVDASTPELRKQSFGKIQLECIMLAQPIESKAVAPLGLFPTYCFDPSKDTLRASYNLGSQLVVRNALGVFQLHHVATNVTYSENGLKTAEGKVVKLEVTDEKAGDLDKVDDLTLGGGKSARIAGGVIAGSIVKKVPPIYPMSARQAHISGSVILKAVIGRDGRIISLRPIKVPDPDLAIAALIAVRQWTYKPYLLNGEPTEVDTTITVNFNFGP